MKALRTALKPVNSLTHYARNSRTHSEDQIAQIAASIEEFGFNNPVLIDADGMIIAGHGRVLAAERLGLSKIPTITLDHLTESQKRAYVIADNKLALNAGWNVELLTMEIEALARMDVDIGVLGFSDEELKALRHRGKDGRTDPEATPPAPEEPVAQVGDVWLLGGHRIACGDSTDARVVSALLDGEQPCLMVTDPPYGVGYTPEWRAEAGVNKNCGKMGKVANDDRADWREAWALFPGDVAYVWHASLQCVPALEGLLAVGMEARAHIIWAKDRFALSRGNYQWQHEPCWYAVRKGKAARFQGDRSQSTLWSINARDDSGHGHGTQKPVECMRRPIVNSSKPGDLVYEPFLGSGTTIIAGEMTGRHIRAVELMPQYVDISIVRWQAFTGQEATLQSTGQTYTEAKAERVDASA